MLAAAAPPPASHVGLPGSIGVIGDSWETGFASSPGSGPIDVRPNNWATGTNPGVRSQYERILAANPRIVGHAYDVARDGAEASDFVRQVQALAPHPLDYVIVALGGNDVCDATPLATFGAEMTRGWRALVASQPDARILAVGYGGTIPVWEAADGSPAAEQDTTDMGGGPCDPIYGPDGKPTAAQVALERSQQAKYDAVLRILCASSVHCRWDGDSLDTLTLVPADVGLDGHPTVSGAAKMAAATWAATFDFADVQAPVSRAARRGSAVVLSATDERQLGGIEYRLGGGSWRRYTRPLTAPPGTFLAWRAVDASGNVEAAHSLRF
jgi:hypothetical protein